MDLPAPGERFSVIGIVLNRLVIVLQGEIQLPELSMDGGPIVVRPRHVRLDLRAHRKANQRLMPAAKPELTGSPVEVGPEMIGPVLQNGRVLADRLAIM